MKEKYSFGFQVWGMVLFGIIMLPTLIWSAIPAPYDILRVESITPTIDMMGSVFQVIMIVLLCTIINKKAKKIYFSKWIILCILACILYFASWVLYYRGITNPVIILGLTVPPCMSFFFFAIDRKNYFAIGPVILFAICHLGYGVRNFIL